MTERDAHILSGVVREYIRTARPVGSSRLAEILPLELSPATIRASLQALEEEGYLQQPHTSAGRIPTDQGYRYYVDHLRARVVQETDQQDMAVQLQELQHQYRHAARAASKLLAHLSQGIALSHILPDGDMHESGLRQFVSQPEGEQPEAMREISALLDDADKYLMALAGEATQVYIGQENPLFPMQHISVVVRSVAAPGDRTIVLAVVGPKRMHYQRNISLINTLAHILQQHTL